MFKVWQTFNLKNWYLIRVVEHVSVPSIVQDVPLPFPAGDQGLTERKFFGTQDLSLLLLLLDGNDFEASGLWSRFATLNNIIQSCSIKQLTEINKTVK